MFAGTGALLMLSGSCVIVVPVPGLSEKIQFVLRKLGFHISGNGFE